jgi:hypothetical protein
MKLCATGRGNHGELTEAGGLYEDLRTAIKVQSDTAVRAAMDALRAYRARTGDRGPLRIYADGKQTPARAARHSTPTARTKPGGSSILADIATIRGQIAAIRHGAIRAGLAARQRPAPVTAPRVVRNLAGVVGRIEYDAIDDLDFEFVVSDEEQERQVRSLIG